MDCQASKGHLVTSYTATDGVVECIDQVGSTGCSFLFSMVPMYILGSDGSTVFAKVS
jgi:hypothetical protein